MALALIGPALAGEPVDVLALEVKRWDRIDPTQTANGTPRKERSEVWTIRADGTDARCLVTMGDHAGHPQWTPEGGRLYFQSDRGGTWQIYRCRPDGSDVQQLTKNEKLNCYGYTLSSDGRWVAYACHPDSSPAGLALMMAGGRDPHFLVRNRGYNYMPSFHPDGKSLVFAGDRDGNYEIYRINLDGTNEVNLTRHDAKDFMPQWGPDGESIYFFRDTTGFGETFRMDADGGNVRQVTKGARHDTMHLSAEDHYGSTDPPAISPDGRRIAYIGKVGKFGKVFVMNADGTDPQLASDRDGPCFRVKWSPDGKLLSFVSWDGPWLQLFVVDAVHGGSSRQITKLHGSVVQVAWRPNRVSSSGT